jgi:hypothetical protein
MKQPHKLPALFLSYIAHMHAGLPVVKYPSKPTWKPEFTEAELEELRLLPKKQRERQVAILRAKYLAEAGGTLEVKL